MVSLAYPDMVVNVQPFETQIRDRLVRERVMAWLAGFFGVLAAILATIGLYGVIAYIAAQRRQEIGIRLALGASRPQVVTLVLRETALMLLVGLGVGAILAIAAARGVAAMLFGLSPYDAPTIVASIALLAASGVAAAAAPAIRAAMADPTEALRCD
jgi:ABC-type antimicrobial peptide transport system permease subunit